jgi:hypothetical protein
MDNMSGAHDGTEREMKDEPDEVSLTPRTRLRCVHERYIRHRRKAGQNGSLDVGKSSKWASCRNNFGRANMSGTKANP